MQSWVAQQLSLSLPLILCLFHSFSFCISSSSLFTLSVFHSSSLSLSLALSLFSLCLFFILHLSLSLSLWLYVSFLRMRELYKRFVKTWIDFANQWICIVLWSRIVAPKRFNSCLTDSFHILDHESLMFSKDLVCGFDSQTDFQKIPMFSRIQRILTNPQYIARNECLKIQICKSESLQILKVQSCESGFANPNLKDSYRRFDFKRFKLWILFVRPKISNYSIRLQIPHPYSFHFVCFSFSLSLSIILSFFFFT